MPNDNDKPEGSIPFLLGEIKARQEATNEKLDKLLKSDKDQEKRISSLEQDRARTVGAAGVISFIITCIGVWWGGHK